MSKYTAFFLITVISIIVSPVFAQQNQNTQEQEIKSLKKQFSDLQSKLKTVENIEKMELITKLAEANTKLLNADFGRFERELRDSNQKWMWGWVGFFGVIFAVIGLALWFVVKSLIADRVEKNLNGFKEAVAQLDEIKNQIKLLHKGHATTFLKHFDHFELLYNPSSSKQTEILSDDVLFEVFNDEFLPLELRYKAAFLLLDRDYPDIISILLEFINKLVAFESRSEVISNGRDFIYLIGETYKQEAYQGLKKFLNRLLKEDPKCKTWFLTYTALSLADMSLKLELSDSLSLLKMALPVFVVTHRESNLLSKLAVYFDKLGEPDSIKEILAKHVTSEMSIVEKNCLNRLEKHDLEYVNKWKSDKAEGKLGYQKSS